MQTSRAKYATVGRIVMHQILNTKSNGNSRQGKTIAGVVEENVLKLELELE